jgi:hypothetical protein
MRIPRDCRAKIKSMNDDRQIHHRPLGVLAISVILLVSGAIALTTGVSLAIPGSLLDRIWALNRRAYIEFATLGRPAGILLMILGFICAIATAGLLKRRKWGWWLSVGLFVVNVAGDAARIFTGEPVKGAFGAAIVAGFVIYLTRSRVREYFGIRSAHA